MEPVSLHNSSDGPTMNRQRGSGGRSPAGIGIAEPKAAQTTENMALIQVLACIIKKEEVCPMISESFLR